VHLAGRRHIRPDLGPADVSTHRRARLPSSHYLRDDVRLAGIVTRDAAIRAREAERRTIDVSGDGDNNNGRDVRFARDEAVAAGVTVCESIAVICSTSP
jgi:hypothetical protein